MKKGLSILILTGIFLIALSGPLHGAHVDEKFSTILTAERTDEIITIDGHANEVSWADTQRLIVEVEDGSIGEVEVQFQALYDNDFIYIHAEWPDPTESIDKKLWTYNGSDWTRSEDEDRLALMWNIDDSIDGFNIGGCAIICHGDRFHTNAPDEKADSWHWKAARTNPAGYADDKFVNSTVWFEKYGPLGVPIDWTGRYPDVSTGGGYKDNQNEDKTLPKYYEPNPIDTLDSRFIFQSEIDSGEALMINADTQFTRGDRVPGYILEKEIGSRGDIEAMGVWKDGFWSLELKRKLNTGNEDDVQFDIAKTYRFGVAIMDNTGGFEAFGKGHSKSLLANTLEFGGSGSEEITLLVLVQEYLATAKSYAVKGDSGLAISSISSANAIYNKVSADVTEIDPVLHLAIVNGFISSRRRGSVSEINLLSQRIEEAILTLQGKREPTKPTLGLKILSFWGEIQLYIFVALSILAIYPLYKALQTTKTPELRDFGVFILIVIMPVFLEGVGRAGTFLKIRPLENMSFTTNQYVTLIWAIGMFIALYYARVGFNEIDKTIRSLRKRTTELTKSNRLKDIFTDIMRHDLLNPIGVIKSLTDLVYDEPLEPQVKEYVDTIAKNADRASEMIEGASNLAKLESEDKLELKQLDLKTLMEIAADAYKTDAENKEMTLSITIKGASLAKANNVIYDVFANLISNAIKYSPTGSTIEAGIEDTGSDWKIAVKDQGEGISDEYKEDIFDRFQRVHKGGVEGTGLGLTIVKKIVEMHKGSVWVEDNPGGGSIFYVTIPKDI